MLDDFGHEMENTQSKMENTLSKMAKVMHLSNGLYINCYVPLYPRLECDSCREALYMLYRFKGLNFQ